MLHHADRLTSFSRDPVAPVELALSDPAKSTRLMRDTFSASKPVCSSLRRCVTTRVNTACEREDVSFMFVAATVRA